MTLGPTEDGAARGSDRVDLHLAALLPCYPGYPLHIASS